MKKRAKSRDIVIVDLQELEWVKVLEVPVPPDLVWLALIKMLHSVQFDRNELGLLVFSIRQYAETIKQPREQKVFERIADKMEEAMSSHPPSIKGRSKAAQRVPNDKKVALRAMRRELREWEKNPMANDPALAEFQGVIERFKAALTCRSRKLIGGSFNRSRNHGAVTDSDNFQIARTSLSFVRRLVACGQLVGVSPSIPTTAGKIESFLPVLWARRGRDRDVASKEVTQRFDGNRDDSA